MFYIKSEKYIILMEIYDIEYKDDSKKSTQWKNKVYYNVNIHKRFYENI